MSPKGGMCMLPYDEQNTLAVDPIAIIKVNSIMDYSIPSGFFKIFNKYIGESNE